MTQSLTVRITSDSIDISNTVDSSLCRYKEMKEDFLHNFAEKQKANIKDLVFIKPVSGHNLREDLRDKAIEEFDLSFQMENDIVNVEKEYLFWSKDIK